MAGDDIAYKSAQELTALYRAGTLSPVEAAEALFARLDDLQPKINAFCIVDRGGALAAARASEQRWRAGTPLSSIDGVPATIKDLMLMRGFPTLRGSHLIENVPDTEDSPAVARLKGDGAVILGKTTTPEFGWIAVGDSPLTGITRNPWNLERTPGGSSAGAAAACAAGIGVLNLGSDGAGSIRIPACFSGVFGIKPTFGRVPAYPPSPMGLLSHHGPITRTVHDAAFMLGRIARLDMGGMRDPYWLPPSGSPLERIEDGIKDWRIAFSPDLGYAKVQPEIAAAVAAAVKQFEALGAHVEEVGKIFDSPREALLTLWGAGAARIVAGIPAEKLKQCDPGFLAVAEAGAGISAVDYLGADLVRNALGRTMGAFHETYDLLLTPMMPVPALPVGEDLNDPASEEHWVDWSPFSYPFNMTRQPAASIPCGLTSGGLPIGLQIVGELHADAKVLRAARAFETTQPVRHPPI
jgi:aspartyl-tRNA(Asn)/glutamyl-tRNA(Gln) amidotransferase subunit A